MIPLARWDDLIVNGIPITDSPSKVDLRLIVSYVTNAKKILEIGTRFGRTTINLAKFSPSDAIVYSIDRDQSCDKSGLNAFPDLLRKIRFIESDSCKFDYSTILGSTESFDVIFIDGGHEDDVAMNDTLNALRIIKPDGFILWHDYCGFNGEYAVGARVSKKLDLPTIPIGEYLGLLEMVKIRR